MGRFEILQQRIESSQVKLAMLRHAVRLATRQVALTSRAKPVSICLSQQGRAFGAITPHHAESALARPFPGASRSEPEMEYIEEPSMLYMTCLVGAPWVFSFWFLVKFV